MEKTIETKSEIQIVLQKDKGRFIEALRSDGLTVFFDKSPDALSEWLNIVRKHCTRAQVFMAVGMVRGLQIAANYAEKHGTDEDRQTIKNQISAMVAKNPLQIG